MHPCVWRELADITVRPLSIVFERSCQLEEASKGWKRANVSPVFKKYKKEGLGNNR